MTPKRVTLWLLACVIGYHALLALGFAKAFHIIAGISLAILLWRIGWANALLTAVSMALAMVVMNLAILVSGADDAIYGSPQSELTTWDFDLQHRRYQKNRDLRAPVRRSDLAGMSTEVIYADPRPPLHRYHTDSFGFRNSVDYQGQRWILVGDSFIAGSGNDQDDILVEQLRRDYQADVYALGHPGDTNDYLQYVRGLAQRKTRPFRVLLFLFEGNDFQQAKPGKPNPCKIRDKRRSLFERHRRLFDDTPGFRFTGWLYRRIASTFSTRVRDRLTLTQVAGKPMAMYRLYVRRSNARSYEPSGAMYAELDAILPWVETIYFIPTKYRVYHRLLDKPVAALPNTYWEWLSGYCTERKVSCTDLTPALSAAAKRLLPQGKTVFWRDDTHWNALGIRVAARVVAEAHGFAPRRDKAD